MTEADRKLYEELRDHLERLSERVERIEGHLGITSIGPEGVPDRGTRADPRTAN
jgi:hypothetical protein